MERGMEKVERTDHWSYASQNCALSKPWMFHKSIYSHKACLKDCLFDLHKKKFLQQEVTFFFRRRGCFFYSVSFIYL